MDRRAILAALAAALMACSSEDKPPTIPAALGGDWKQSGVSNPASVSPLLGSYEPARVWEASYAGPVPLSVTYHKMKSDTVAFELMQKWRSGAGSTHFHHGPMFVVIRAAGTEPARLNAIAKEVEDALKR